MLDHGVEHLVVGHIGAVEAEVGCDRLLGAEPVARTDARAVVQPLELIARRRALQLFVDPNVEPVVAQDLERLSRRSAHRVVINFRFHVGSFSGRGFKRLNKDLTVDTSFPAQALSRLRNDAPSSSFLRL
jgi:hypothetical protein